MPIKKRPQTDAAAIEAFGAAAEPPAEQATDQARPPQQSPATSGRRHTPTSEAAQPPSPWPTDVAKTLLIRWPDAQLALDLADVAALEDRSQHKTALRALQRGLEVLRAENER